MRRMCDVVVGRAARFGCEDESSLDGNSILDGRVAHVRRSCFRVLHGTALL